MNDIEKKLNTISALYFVLAVLCIPASFIAPVVMFHAMSGAAPQVRAIMMFAAGAGLIGSFILTACIALVGHAIRKRRGERGTVEVEPQAVLVHRGALLRGIL